ncbi:MAG TPA: molybdopterin cofactor-binding domain-containing protein [Phenylobacterium sp.]|nr:molybdopterin cofactor-binding domain-containing protein [Phenylobacterium sp.]
MRRRRRDRPGPGLAPLPLRRAQPHPGRRGARRAASARRGGGVIPANLQNNPRLDRWVRFLPEGRVWIAFGKTENGQGVGTALAQLAAGELGVAFPRLVVAPVATGEAPDEGTTFGSISIETSGAAVRAACAEVRALTLAAAAAKLDCEAAALDIVDGAVVRDGRPTGEDYWTLAGGVDLAVAPSGVAPLRPPADLAGVGDSEPRTDLPAKLFGAAFLHDMALPGMRHARVLRQPGPNARLVALDEAAIRTAAQAEVDILQDGAFVAVVCATEAAALRALAAAEAAARWEGVVEIAPALAEPASLRELPSDAFSAGAPPPERSNRRRHTARYGKPYLAHGSMGPSCGVAQFEGGRLTVWTHNQAVYPMRATLARVLGLDPAAIDVRHAQGPGCYGHNGADDAAVDAATIAVRRPGPPVRVQWRREDEFAWAPVGTAMAFELSAELDPSGRLADYTAGVWTGPQTSRGRTLAETALPGDIPPPPPLFPPPPPGAPRFSAGLFNAIPSYDIAAARTVEHVVAEPPVRTSSLRGVGGPPNIFAGECFIDELAEIAGHDPLAYRLSMLTDPRGRAVLERLGAMCDWERRWETGTGRGLGLSYDRHRSRGAWCAVAAEVEVDAEVRLVKLWCAVDGGLIVNPDGAKNQLEGGMVMAASWTLKEQVKLGGAGIASSTWDDYPILRFSEVPPIEVELLNVRQEPAYGLGEISQGGTMAAIANAVAHALGARIRDLPLTRDKIAAALLAG